MGHFFIRFVQFRKYIFISHVCHTGLRKNTLKYEKYDLSSIVGKLSMINAAFKS